MKRMIAVGLIVNVVLLAVVGMLHSKGRMGVVHAAGGGTVPIGNGDVNGDGTIDISDAVYLLSSLFLGGPAPVAIECPPPAAKGLPATGQTKCYGFDVNQGVIEVPCDKATCQGQDSQYAVGCPTEGRFVDNGDVTVTDHCTGLMWQKDTADVNALLWCDALAYCENLTFAGHDDWRLPNVRELQSIVDYGRVNPSIDSVFGAMRSYYWSSTSVAGLPAGAWLVGFGDDNDGGNSGVTNGHVKGDPYFYVRAVRNAP